jgi:putative FmdB family regulatory protein
MGILRYGGYPIVPFYSYFCSDCRKSFDLFEGIHDGKHDMAVCECGQAAQRVFTPPQVFVDQIKPHFNHGLGKRVSSRHEIREAQREYKDRTGSNLIEVGNELPRGNKPIRSTYETAGQMGR